MAGIHRSRAIAPIMKKAADADVLRTIAGDDLHSVRDRALLAVGLAGAF